MPKTSFESYCLFKKQTSSGRVWYVKFWNKLKRSYDSIKSTGVPVEGKLERRWEAENTAQKMDFTPASIQS